ncbi:MAG: Tryptophan-rich protein TspO [Chlamydiales bacterium]|nr:Tryptophan-rich protein TspO [Chlamydiales bacterium]
MRRMKKKDVIFLVCALALVFSVELIGGLFTAQSVSTWYPTLNKPIGTPPSWVFGPVWTILYILMALSLYFVWRQKGSLGAYFCWGLQLFLNLIWSLLFFTLQNPLLGLIDICALWLAIVATLIACARYSYWASILLVPYLIWVSYALFLNAMIYVLN